MHIPKHLFSQATVGKTSSGNQRTAFQYINTYLPGRTYTDHSAIRNSACSTSTGTIQVGSTIPGGAILNISSFTVPPGGGYVWPLKVTFTTPTTKGMYSYSLFGTNFFGSTQTVIVTDSPTVRREYDFYVPINNGGVDTVFSVTNRSFNFDEACNKPFREAITYRGSIYPQTSVVTVVDSIFTVRPDETKFYRVRIANSSTAGHYTFYKEMAWNGGQDYAGYWLDSAIIYDRINVHYIDSILFVRKKHLALCPGGSFYVPYETIGNYNVDNYFTVQLSDKTGSFDNPLNIGTLKARSADSILCTIPNGTPLARQGYNMRIISSSPADTSELYKHFYDDKVISIADNYRGFVQIQSDKGNLICDSTPVTFTAQIHLDDNLSIQPHFRWYLNNLRVGSDNSQYTTDTLKDKDIITCEVYSFSSCPILFQTAELQVKVIKAIIPSVDIHVFPSVILCDGESTAGFEATYQYEGEAPLFQWYKNGQPVGDGTPVYIDDQLNHNDKIYLVMTSSMPCAQPQTVASNEITITKATSITPSVSIVPYQYISTLDTGDSLCPGTAIIFFAYPVDGGFFPSYQWFKNGVEVGNDDEYIDYNPMPGDQYYAKMTSDLPCANPAVVNSNTVTIQGLTSVVPRVEVVANPKGPICPNTEVIFVPKARFGGNEAEFEWRKNGILVEQDDQYEADNLQNGDRITVTMYSSLDCATPDVVTSEPYIVSLADPIAVVTTITASPSGKVCPGTTVTYNAQVTNGGPTPIYQWRKNGVIVGTNSPTFVSTAIQNNDIIECWVSSSLQCASPTIAKSNALVMDVGATLTPSVVVVQNPSGKVCPDEPVTFTAVPDGGGTSPSYQWLQNGLPIGTNSDTYTVTNLPNGATISVQMTSNLGCATPKIVNANPQIVDVGQTPAYVEISSTPTGIVCPGKTFNFRVIKTRNAGSNPSFQWKVNGVNAGTNSATFTTTNLANGSIVTCTLFSNSACANPSAATSNAITVNTYPASLSPSISITARPQGVVCNGTLVMFTASTVNAGINPVYQWRVNGQPTGISTPVFSSRTLKTGDVVTSRITQNDICASGKTATSNAITMTVTNSRTTYKFIGSGAWEDSQNWENNNAPPSTVSGCVDIIIDPAGATECVLNSTLTISGDVHITVVPGKKFKVLGSIFIQ
jgi:hypothetical protein